MTAGDLLGHELRSWRKGDLSVSYEELEGSMEVKPTCCETRGMVVFAEPLPCAKHFNKILWTGERPPRRPRHGTPRLYPRSAQSESMAGGSRHQYYFNPQAVPLCSWGRTPEI